MDYYAVKCSYGAHEFRYKRKHSKHNHGKGKDFSKEAKDQALVDLGAAGVAVAGLTTGDIRTSGYQDKGNDPGDDFTDI